MAANTIKRDILFFRVNIGLGQNGKPKVFDPTPVFEYISKLNWKDGKNDNRYFDNDGKMIGCWVESTGKPCKIALGNIRRTDLPQLEMQGELTPLEIPETAGLVETTHIVFLGDNIVGCDNNFYGPRISRLPFYLSDKALRVAPEYIYFSPILRQDVYQQFKKFRSLSLLELRIRASYADNVSLVDDNLGAALKSAYKAGDTDDVELVLRASSNSHSWLADRLLDALKLLSRRPEIRDEADKFVVKGYNEEKTVLQELNLLSDKLVITKNIRKLDARSRALNSKDLSKNKLNTIKQDGA